jgi:transitional endoplasmic reticulum ATPase
MSLFVEDEPSDWINACRVNAATYRALGLPELDGGMQRAFVLLAGKLRRTTAVILDGSTTLDGGVVAMNRAARANLRVSLGDSVRFVKVVNDLPVGTRVDFAAMVDISKPEFAVDKLRKEYLEPFLDSLQMLPVKLGDVVFVPRVSSVVRFKVVMVVAEPSDPPNMCVLRRDGGFNTAVTVVNFAVDPNKVVAEDVGYDTIGGMRSQLAQIREMVELPLRYPELFEALGVVPPRGVLMYGPPGTGKTLIARAVANESGAFFKLINGPEIMAGGPGESEANLRKAFEEATRNTPAILFIDEVDAIAPGRDKGGSGEVERRIVAQLLTLMDGMKGREQVIVIGATNRPNAIDPALRRYGRFDREIEIGVPNKEGRSEIFAIHSRGMRLDPDVDADVIAQKTHGFVGADIASLCTEAGMVRVRKEMGLFDLGVDTIGAGTLETATVCMEDFTEALAKASPASLREALVQKPDVSWDSIGGNDAIKQSLKEMITYPVRYPDLFAHFKQSVSKGVLMHGPPGCGKTMIAKALATEADANFLSVKGPELLTKWFGESEANVRELFDKARAAAPCILFFDEFDSIAKKRCV